MLDILLPGAILFFLLTGALMAWGQRFGPAPTRARSLLRIGLLLLLLAPLLAGTTWRLSKSRDWQLCGKLVKCVETTQPLIALTFDDGPSPEYTGPILDMLSEKGVQATFFLTGKEIEANPAQARAIVEAGHELGNHSYSHRRMMLCSTAFIRREIESTDALIRAAGYQGPIHFRPPYAKRLLALPFYLSRTGRTTVLFDVEPESYPHIANDATRILQHSLERVQPGSILLLHLMYPGRSESRKALPRLIDALREKGYRFVRVSTLLAL